MGMREFEQNGEFSDIHEALLNQIRGRHGWLRMKVDAAAREGTRLATCEGGIYPVIMTTILFSMISYNLRNGLMRTL